MLYASFIGFNDGSDLKLLFNCSRTSIILYLTVMCSFLSSNFLIRQSSRKDLLAISCFIRDPQFSAMATNNDRDLNIVLASFVDVIFVFSKLTALLVSNSGLEDILSHTPRMYCQLSEVSVASVALFINASSVVIGVLMVGIQSGDLGSILPLVSFD